MVSLCLWCDIINLFTCFNKCILFFFLPICNMVFKDFYHFSVSGIEYLQMTWQKFDLFNLFYTFTTWVIFAFFLPKSRYFMLQNQYIFKNSNSKSIYILPLYQSLISLPVPHHTHPLRNSTSRNNHYCQLHV